MMASKRRIGKFFRRVPLWAFVVAWALTMGCVQEYDMERSEQVRGTLGEELHAIWIKDTARGAVDAEPRTALLDARQQEFITSVDRAVPPGKVHELDHFLIAFLPVIEDGYFPALTRRIPFFIQEAIADDELMESLENPPVYSARDFLTPFKRGRTLEEAVKYKDLPLLMAHLGQVFIDYDGLDESGNRDLEVPVAFAEMLRAIADLMQQEPAPGASDRWATALRDLFVVPDNRYRGGEVSRRSYVALFDDDGFPVVRTDSDGEIVSPFVDLDGNGRADVDGDGRFILDDGQRLAIPPLSNDTIDHPGLHRDIYGRAETSPGRSAFEYVDLSDTSIPYLVRMAGVLAEDDVFYHFTSAARDVLGPPSADADDRGTYLAYPDEHPVVDLGDAVISGLAISELPEVMKLTAQYINRSADDLAFLSYALGNAAETLIDSPGADIFPNQTLIFDLLDVFREITADPELWADVIEALRDPILLRGGEAMSTLIQYRDAESVPEDGGPYDGCFQGCKNSHDIGTEVRFECIRGCPQHELFSEETDFMAPESKGNRSRFQRLFHLLRDTSGVEYELALVELQEPWLGLNANDFPPIVTLPGAAEAFVRSVAGELHMTDYISDEFGDSAVGSLVTILESLTGGAVDDGSVANVLSVASELFGARLDPEPTPDQITRLFNQVDLRAEFEEDGVVIDVNNPICKDGFVMANHHADGLYAAEASGLIDVLYPLARAFAKHDREELLTSIFLIVHDHYSRHTDLYKDVQGNSSPMKASNLVSLEPALKEIFDDGEIFDALRVVGLSTQGLTDDEGVTIDERLRQLLHKWVRNDDGYSPRSEPYILELADGRQIDSVSRIDVIIDRFAAMIDRAEENEQTKEHFRRAAEGFFENVLSAQELTDGTYVFTEEGVVALSTHLLRYLGERAREMEERGEFEVWLTEELPDRVMKFYSSRGFYALVELLNGLHESEEGRRLIKEAILHFSETGERADNIGMAIYAIIVQALDMEALMPAGRFAMEILDPDRQESVDPHRGLPNGTLVAHLLARIPEVDHEGYGIEILARGSRMAEDSEPTWTVLSDLLLRYFSPEPMATGTLSRQAREVSLGRLGDWLQDDQRGLERFFKLVELRGNMELEAMPE